MNSEDRARPPPSWEPRAKCVPTRDRNPGHAGQTGFHSPRLLKARTWAGSAFRPLGPSRPPATSCSLAGGCRHMAQEAPRRRKAAETCPGSTRLWSPNCPSAELPRGRRDCRKGRRLCSDPSQKTSAAPAFFRPAPTGPRKRSHSAQLGGQARLGPQWIVRAKGQRPRRPAAQPWRPEPGRGRGSAPGGRHAANYEPHKAVRQAQGRARASAQTQPHKSPEKKNQ